MLCGSWGPVGTRGPQGWQGFAGHTGPKGYTGPQGSTGLRGATGILGAAGVQGLKGLTGPTGEAGPAGLTGAGGLTGLSYSALLWSSVTDAVATASVWKTFVYGSGVFLAAGIGALARSVDGGRTWSSVAVSGGAPATWVASAYGSGVMWVLGSGGTSACMRSTDQGASWQDSPIPASPSWSCMTYGSGVLLALSSSGTVAARSTDLGLSWSTVSITTGSWKGLAFGSGSFVAASASGAKAVSTNGGVSWSYTSTAYPSVSLAYCDGRFVSVGGTGFHEYSPDGSLWNSASVIGTGKGLAAGSGEFIAVSGTAGSASASSANITAWLVSSALSPALAWDCVGFGGGTYVASAPGGGFALCGTWANLGVTGPQGATGAQGSQGVPGSGNQVYTVLTSTSTTVSAPSGVYMVLCSPAASGLVLTLPVAASSTALVYVRNTSALYSISVQAAGGQPVESLSSYSVGTATTRLFVSDRSGFWWRVGGT